MAGGLFGAPFAVNPKCLAFSIIVVGLFMWRPAFSSPVTKWGTVGVLSVIAYVAMAWYDYFFDCRIEPLRRGTVGGPTQRLKPPAHVPEKQRETGRNEDPSSHRKIVYALHLLVIAPLLGYVAYKGRGAPRATWTILGTVAALTAGYHGVRLLGMSYRT